MIPRFLLTVVLAFAAALSLPSVVSSGSQRDAICGSSGCGGAGCRPCSSSDGGSGSWRSGGGGSAWTGTATIATLRGIKSCDNPFCVAFQGSTLLPIAMILDTPYYAIQGVKYGLIYGGKGLYQLGKGAAWTGRGLASAVGAPGRKRRAKNSSLAHSTAANCSGASGGSFDAYTSWEECKRAVLKRQKAMTKLNPANKENENWCKGHLPLSSGPNRMNWEARCNPGGGEKLVEAPKPPADTAAAANTGSTAAAGTAANASGAATADAKTGAAGASQNPAAGPTGPNAALAAAGAMAELLAGQAVASEAPLVQAGAAEAGSSAAGPAAAATVPIVEAPTPNFAPLLPGTDQSAPAGAAPGVPLTPFSQGPSGGSAATPDMTAASVAGQAWDGNPPDNDDPLVQLAQLTGRMPVSVNTPPAPAGKPAAAVSRDSGNYDAASISGAGRTVSSTKPEKEKERAPVVMMDAAVHWKRKLAMLESELSYLRVAQANEALGNLLSMGAAKTPVKGPIHLTIPRELLTRAARRQRDGLPDKTPDTPANESIAMMILNAEIEKANLKRLLNEANGGGPAATPEAKKVGAQESGDTGAFTVIISPEPTVGGTPEPACAKKTVQTEQWILVPEAAGKNAAGETLYKEVYRRLPLTVELNFCD